MSGHQVYRRYTWASRSGGKVVSGLLIGFGVLLLVVTEILPCQFSKTIMAISFCIIAFGIIGLFIGYRRLRPHRHCSQEAPPQNEPLHNRF